MGRRLWILALGAMLTVAGWPALAEVNGFSEASDPALALAAPRGGGMTRLARLWARRRVALESNDLDEAKRLLDEAAQLRRELGVRRLDSMAFSLVREAETLRGIKKYPLAEARLEAARELAPNLPEVEDAAARLAFSASPFALHRVALAKVSSLRLEVADFQRRMLLLSDGVLTALVLGLTLGLLFLISQLGRYGLHLYHDLGQTFPAVMKFVVLAAAAVLVITPLFYGIGPFMLVFPAAIVLWVYQKPTERVVSFLMIAALGASPWTLRAGDRLSDAGTGLVGALAALETNPYDQRARGVVAQAVEEDDSDWHARAVLGLALKRAGRLAGAARLLSDAAAIVEDRALRGRIFVNLGNVWFGLGRAAAAEEAYRRAAKLLRTDARPFFNLHRLFLRQRQLGEAEAQLKKASSLDSQVVADWNRDDDPGLNRFVVDAPLPAAVLTRRALAGLLSPAPFAHRVWVGFAGPLPEMTAPAAALATMLAWLLLFSLRKRQRLSWPCSRCGQRAEVFVYPDRPDAPLCEPCEAIFVHNKPVDRATRFQKESEISRFQSITRWTRRLSALTLPGLGAMADGRTVRGVLLAGLSLWLLLRLALPGGVLFGPFTPEISSDLARWATIGALAALWVGSAYRVVRPREVS